LENLGQDPRFATNAARVKNRTERVPIVAEAMRSKKGEEWLQLLEEAGIPCGPINTLDQVFADPQVEARGMVEEVAHPTIGAVKLVATPLNLSRTPCKTTLHPPVLGEHTEEILQDKLEFSLEKIQQLREKGAV
jgi:formyl-CoA transferase